MFSFDILDDEDDEIEEEGEETLPEVDQEDFAKIDKMILNKYRDTVRKSDK